MSIRLPPSIKVEKRQNFKEKAAQNKAKGHRNEQRRKENWVTPVDDESVHAAGE